MSTSRSHALLSAALGHFIVDLFAALVPILLAQLSRAFGLSNAQIGLAVLSYTLTSALSQPLFGFLADRVGGRRLAVAGVLWNGLWMAVAGFAPSYPLLVGALMLAGFGSGAYHPQGAVRATLISAVNRGRGTSIFFLGGAIGMAVGPLAGGQMLATLGAGSLGLVSLLAIPIAYEIWHTFADEKPEGARIAQLPGGSVGLLANVPLLTFGALVVAHGLRGWMSDSLTAYIPKFYLDRGLTPAQYGLITSIYLVGSSVGGLLGGLAADRLNKKAIISAALAGAVVCLYGLFHSMPAFRFVFAFGTGLCLSLPFTPALLIFQTLMPDRLTTITGLVMTYVFLAGGVGTSVTGILGDRLGLARVMDIDVALLAVACLASIFISRHAGQNQTVVPGPAAAARPQEMTKRSTSFRADVE